MNRSKYKNVRMCPKLKRPTSESQFKLKEKLPTESALDNQTMNTHQQKSGILISQAMNNFNQAKLETTYLMFNIWTHIFNRTPKFSFNELNKNFNSTCSENSTTYLNLVASPKKLKNEAQMGFIPQSRFKTRREQ